MRGSRIEIDVIFYTVGRLDFALAPKDIGLATSIIWIENFVTRKMFFSTVKYVSSRLGSSTQQSFANMDVFRERFRVQTASKCNTRLRGIKIPPRSTENSRNRN